MQLDIAVGDAEETYKKQRFMSLPTTLYEVIAAIQDNLKPYDQDALVTAAVVHMLNTQRVVMHPGRCGPDGYSVRPTFA